MGRPEIYPSFAHRRGELYQGYLFRPQGSGSWEGSSLTRKALVRFALEGSWTEKRIKEHVENWDKTGYKVGLRIGEDQHIAVSYRGYRGRGVVLQEDPALTRQLNALFQPVTAEKWVGLVRPHGARRWHRFEKPNFVWFEMTVKIMPARERSQVIPYVGRYANDGFQKGYLPGLWYLSGQI